MTTKYLYGKMTWPEIKEAAAQERVALLPTGVHRGPRTALAAGRGRAAPHHHLRTRGGIGAGPVRGGAGGRPTATIRTTSTFPA